MDNIRLESEKGKEVIRERTHSSGNLETRRQKIKQTNQNWQRSNSEFTMAIRPQMKIYSASLFLLCRFSSSLKFSSFQIFENLRTT